MSDLSTVGIVGTDGKTPIYDPEATWKIWGKHEVWLGGTGAGKFVPKVKDYVIDVDLYITYIVDHIDPVTLIPTLRQITANNVAIEFSKTDILFGPGVPYETYRIYLDKRVTPYVMAVDQRATIPGSAAKYAKVFKVVDGEAKCISKIYSGSGEFISENIPLELIKSDSHETHLVKGVPVFHTTDDLADNELVLIVFYTDSGVVVMKRQLIVENTSFIRGIEYSTKYVSHISLECPFLSTSVPDEISFPINMTIDSLNLVGVVHYSDGSTAKYPVDGNRFRIYGLDRFVSSIEGQTLDLVLAYPLAATEQAYAAAGLASDIVTTPYTLRVVNPNHSYSVKLFGYPEWISAVEGYRMRWWLYNLDRDIYHDVTSLVKFDENKGLFDPFGYGYTQLRAVSINLRDVSASYKAFIHTQTIAISLVGAPESGKTSWVVANDPYTSIRYGKNVECVKVSGSKFSIANDCTTLDEWLEKIYYNTQPIIDKLSETKAPKPTHYIITSGTTTIGEYEVAEWANDITTASTLKEFSNIYVRFVRRVGEQTLELSTAAMLVKY